MKILIEILLLIGFVVEFILGIFVYLKNRLNAVNKYFCMLMISGSLWCLFLFFGIIFNSDFLVRMSTVGGLFANTFFLLFAKAFHKLEKVNSKFFIIILLFPFLLTPIILFSNVILGDITFLPGGIIEVPDGYLVLIFYAFHFFYGFMGFYYLIKGYKNAKGIRKIQFQYLFIGLGFLLFWFFFMNMVLPLFGVYNFISLSSISLIILAILFLYIITRYRFMGIRLLIKKGTVHVMGLGVVLVLYSFLILFFQHILIERYDWNFTAAMVLAAIIIAVSVEPLRRLVVKAINRLFYTPSELKKEKALKSAITFSSTNELETVVEKVLSVYIDILVPSFAYFLVRDHRKREFKCLYPKSGKKTISFDDPLSQYFRVDPQVLVAEEVFYMLEDGHLDQKLLKEVAAKMEKTNTAVAVPLGVENTIYAIALIGPKKDKEAYTKEDIDLLNQFQFAASPVIINAIMYKEAVERITRL